MKNIGKTSLLRVPSFNTCATAVMRKLVMRQGACADFWNALNMAALSPNDDSS
jgi:hypothetical protein